MGATAQEVAQIIANNRIRKAIILADTLQARNFTLDMIRELSDHGWHIVAASAGTKTPPSEETRKLVVEIMEHREKNGGRDPFRKF